MKETKFKQTEVGMIPIDWEVKKLGHLCSLWGRIGFRGYTREDLVEAHKGAITFSPSDIHNQKIDLENCTYISLKKYEESPEIKVFNGDIIFGKTASIGKCALVEGLSEKATINPQFVLMNNFKCNNRFLYYQLIDKPFQTNIWTICGGSTIPTMSQEKLKQQQIAFPSTYAEQTAIANDLSDVDTLIANLEKLIAKKKNIKQGAMQQLLTGKKRLPRFAPASPTYKQTELGQIPSDWEFVPVSELAKDMADGPFGSNLKKEHYTSDPQTRIIQLSNIGENGWEDENTKYTTFEHAKTIARCIVPKEESILVAKMMPAGRAIICPKKEKQYVLGSDVIRITANEKLNSKYFVYASKSDAYLKQISDNTQGSTRQRTSISKLRKILILLPSLAEQTAIANVLSDMDTEISALETKLAKYRTLKTGMMQQLLTGKIRLV